MTIKRIPRLAAALALLPLAGCMTPEEITARFIAEMDARAPEDRVPNWESTRALMMREPPQVGTDAPDFTLTTHDGSDTYRLSQYEGDKPVVLIFGSWT